jgi:MoaA/NifB/PqqE/SkfB family radical SAM enzyme
LLQTEGISLSNIFDSAKKAAIGKGLELALKHAKKDSRDGLMDIISLFENHMPSTDGNNGFSTAREILGDSDSKWTIFANSLLSDVAINIIKTILLNGSYEAGYKGREISKSMKAQYRTNIPLSIVLDPTGSCNLNCAGCLSTLSDGSQYLTNDEMDSIISQGKKLGIYSYHFSGGEPLLRKADILKLCNKHDDCIFHIITNGTLIDRQFCIDVRNSGNIFLSVSLDGMEKANDGLRGNGVFEKVMASMSLMKNEGLLFGAAVCSTGLNYKDATSDEFFDLLISKGCKYCLYFQYMPVGNSAVPEKMLSPEQREYMNQRIRYIRSQECKKPIFTADFPSDEELLGGCIAGGRGFLHINANGYVEPCIFIHYSNANIRRVSLLDALRQPLFSELANNQSSGESQPCPCPLLKNPQLLQEAVNKSRAKPTDLLSPESVEQLCEKCVQFTRD